MDTERPKNLGGRVMGAPRSLENNLTRNHCQRTFYRTKWRADNDNTFCNRSKKMPV